MCFECLARHSFLETAHFGQNIPNVRTLGKIWWNSVLSVAWWWCNQQLKSTVDRCSLFSWFFFFFSNLYGYNNEKKDFLISLLLFSGLGLLRDSNASYWESLNDLWHGGAITDPVVEHCGDVPVTELGPGMKRLPIFCNLQVFIVGGVMC